MNDDFQIKNETAQLALREIADVVKGRTPSGMGFAVFMFDYGENGAMFYASSAQRADMIEAMKEFIAKNS